MLPGSAAVGVAGCLGGLFGGGEESRRGESAWEPVTAGLPEKVTFQGLLASGTTVYASVDGEDGSGVFELEAGGSEWTRVAAPPDKYGTGSLIVSETGRLFVHRNHHGLAELVDESGEGTWECVSCRDSSVTPGEASWPEYVAAGDGRLVAGAGTSNPEMYEYDLASETWTDLEFPFGDLDGKPHVDLLIDGQGRVWYRSNYSGIYTYDGESWTQTSSQSGAVSTDGDGDVYLSFERTGGTQLAGIFRYADSGSWELIHETKGYSVGGTALDDESRMFFVSGRFGAVATEAEKLWQLPSHVGDVDVGLGDKALRSHHRAAADDGTVYVTRSLDDYHSDESFDRRLLRMRPELENEPFYSTDLSLDAGTYVGSEAPVGVHILDDGDILVAVNTDSQYPSASTTRIGGDGDSDGRLLRLSPDGRSLERVYLPGSPVLDVAVGDDGEVAVATERAVTGVDLATGATTWQLRSDADSKVVAYGATGHHVLKLDATVRVFSPGHEEVHADEVATSYLTDVDVDGATESYYLTGFDNKTLPDGSPVQVAYLRAYGFDGERQWETFGFDGKGLSNNVADTRLYHVTHHGGELIIGGESAGTQTVFRYDGDRYDGEPSVRVIDHYNDLWDSGSAHVAYHARFDAESGEHRASQLTMTRRSDGKSNTFRVNDVTVDGAGRVYVGGQAAARLAARPAQTVDGRAVGEYAGPEPSLLVVTPEFDQRRTWTTFNERAATGAVTGVDARDGKTAVVARVDSGSAFTQGPQVVPEDDGGQSYLAVFDQAKNYSYTATDS
jgi:hypothetical protein